MLSSSSLVQLRNESLFVLDIILWSLVTSYLMPSLIFCSGVMESAVADHQEQIGGTGHTEGF
jgi:hypothetical protein